MLVKYLVNHNVNLMNFFKYKLKYYLDIKKEKKSYNFNLIVICGCGHSGTTLVADRLGKNDEVYFPGKETNIFNLTNKYNKSILDLLYLVNEAKNNNKKFILEKTPKHVYSINRINKINSYTKFIFVVRNPLDTVFSLEKRFKSIDYAIERYIYDNEELIKHVNKERCLLIKYEDFVLNNYFCMKKICDFTGLNLDKFNDELSGFDSNESSPVVLERLSQINKPLILSKSKYLLEWDINKINYVKSKTSKVAELLGYDDF